METHINSAGSELELDDNGHLRSERLDFIQYCFDKWGCKKPNVPLHSKPLPVYVGLQKQLYEPWVLMQEAFGWHFFILISWPSLHSSMSEREQAYFTLQPR